MCKFFCIGRLFKLGDGAKRIVVFFASVTTVAISNSVLIQPRTEPHRNRLGTNTGITNAALFRFSDAFLCAEHVEVPIAIPQGAPRPRAAARALGAVARRQRVAARGGTREAPGRRVGVATQDP